MSLTSLLDQKQSPLRRFMDAQFSDVAAVRVSYRAYLPTDLPVLIPALPPEGTRVAWATIGAAIDHRLRYSLASEVKPGGAVIGGIQRAALTRQDGQGKVLFEVGKALLGDLVHTVRTHRPFDRGTPVLLSPDVEHHLIRCCCAAVWFEEVFRSGRLAPSTPVGWPDVPADLETFLAQMPDYAVADIREVVALSEHGLADVRDVYGADDVVVGPTFDGSRDVGGADADWIAGRTLVDVKSTIRPRDLDAKTVYQLLGYVLLDYNDNYRIDEVGFYLSRADRLITWPLGEFLALAGATEPLADLRQQVRGVVKDAHHSGGRQ